MSPASRALRMSRRSAQRSAQRLETVQAHYAQLFEREAPLSAAKGKSRLHRRRGRSRNDRDALPDLGFKRSEPCGGRHPRLASRPHPRHAQRARPRTADETRPAAARRASRRPPIPTSPSRSSTACSRVCRRGVQLFSLFLANPQLLDLVATIVGSAPRLADTMARAPATLDALLDARFPGDAAVARRARPFARTGVPDGARLRRRARRRPPFRPRTDFPRRRADHRRQGRKRGRRAGLRQHRRSDRRGPARRRAGRARADGGPRAGRRLRRHRHGQARRARDDGRFRSRSHLRL